MKLSKRQYGLAAVIVMVLLLPGSMMRGQQTAPGESPENLHLLVGRSLVLSSPARIKRVSVADPNIIDVVAVNPKQLVIDGKSPGGTSLVLWDETGQSQEFEVYVDLDTRGLADRFREVFPDQPVKLVAQNDVVVLSGRVASQAMADKMLEMAKAMAPKAVSLLEGPAPLIGGEVLLQVKFAEVDRTAISQFGINILSLPGSKNVGQISTGQFSPPTLEGSMLTPIPSSGPPTTTTSTVTGATTTTSTIPSDSFLLPSLLNIFLFRPDINLGATISALAQQNLAQILAEPNVLAENGKEASFLSGGEFPYPIVQQGGAGSIPIITVQFREYGIRLTFTPVLTPDGNIHLKARPEVSALDYTNTVTIGGYVMPALSTRRVESEMVLKDGQSFAIAGLVNNQLTSTIEKVPGLGDIPLLGNLFRSHSLNKSKTELLVLVTPRIVKPLEPSQVSAGPSFPKTFLPPAKAEKPAAAEK
jgi:pilus assembly protein CpaC